MHRHSGNQHHVLHIKKPDGTEIRAESPERIDFKEHLFGTSITLGKSDRPSGFWNRFLGWRVVTWVIQGILVAVSLGTAAFLARLYAPGAFAGLATFVAQLYAQGIPLLGGP